MTVKNASQRRNRTRTPPNTDGNRMARIASGPPTPRVGMTANSGPPARAPSRVRVSVPRWLEEGFLAGTPGPEARLSLLLGGWRILLARHAVLDHLAQLRRRALEGSSQVRLAMRERPGDRILAGATAGDLKPRTVGVGERRDHLAA